MFGRFLFKGFYSVREDQLIQQLFETLISQRIPSASACKHPRIPYVDIILVLHNF